MRPSSRASRVAAALAACLASLGARPLLAQLSPESGLSLSGRVCPSFSAWEDKGSAFVPRGSLAGYAAGILAELRAEAGALGGPEGSAGSGASSSCGFEGALSLDAVSGTLSFVLRELWAEWDPVEPIALRAGRQRLGFGSGFGWNPSNDLDPRRDPYDPSAPRSGIDACHLRIDAGGAVGFPLSLSLVAIPPLFGPGVDLSRSRLGAQAYAFVGGIELSAVASASDLAGGPASWLLGGWATLPLGRLVIGLEGSARRRSDYFVPDALGFPVADRGVHGALDATATLRAGDFVLIGEVYWDQASYSREELAAITSMPDGARAYWIAALAAPGTVGPLHCLAQLAWSSGDLSASCGAIIDAATGASALSGELSLAIEGNATAKVGLAAPLGETASDELGISGVGWSAVASLSVYF